MGPDLEILSRLMSSSGGGLNAAILIAFIIVSVWKNDRIQNPYLFRCAAVLFAATVAFPGAVNLLMTMISGVNSSLGGGPNRGEFNWIFGLTNALISIANGASIFLMIFSLLPPMAVSPHDRGQRRGIARRRDIDDEDDDDEADED